MGILKLRDLFQIHDKKVNLSTSAGYTTPTYINHKPYEFKGLVSQSSYNGYGCCTSYASKQNDDSIKYENSFIGLPISAFPTSYRNMELVTEWVDFMNKLFPFFDIKIITDFKQNIINPEYWEEKGLRFTFNSQYIYFVIKKDITINRYINLFQLSLLRYLCSSEYYFMVHDCLNLRKKKSLSKLSNWQIMDIVRFGVQVNSHQFDNEFAKNNGFYNYGFLRDYRSPLFNRYYANTLPSEADVIKKLYEGTSQNVACTGKYLKIDTFYLMKLFELGHYHKLYKIINDPKYFITDDGDSKKLLKFIREQYNNNGQFHLLNQRKFKYKEYEKTL